MSDRTHFTPSGGNGSATIRVLVAEDERPLRAALCDLVGAEPDIEIVGAAEDAPSAIRCAWETRPDVALVDVRMPGGGGPVAAREIRVCSPVTRVLALSAYEDRASVLEMLAAGAVGYLVKGTAPHEIVEAVRRAHRGFASLSAVMFGEVVETLLRDTAERAEAERASRGDDGRFRALIESVPDGVVVTGVDGVVVLANRQAELLFGYERGRLVGQAVDVLLPERLRAHHPAHRGSYPATSPSPVVRPMGAGLEACRGLRSDGSEFPIDVSLSPIETDDGTLLVAFVRDMTERRVDAQLQRTLAERRSVLAHVVSAGEEERRRIANDIHDDSIQAITAAGMRLQILRRRLDDPELLGMLGELEATIQLSIERLRHLLFELRPPVLDNEGLQAAVEMYVDQAREEPRLRCSVEDRLVSQPPPETRLVLYRIAQEALTNVRRHAHATSTRVLLSERDGGYLVRISDDGVGFREADVGSPPAHLGLASIRERAELAGGSLRIDTAPAAGTTLEVWIPEPEPARTGNWERRSDEHPRARGRGRRAAVRQGARRARRSGEPSMEPSRGRRPAAPRRSRWRVASSPTWRSSTCACRAAGPRPAARDPRRLGAHEDPRPVRRRRPRDGARHAGGGRRRLPRQGRLDHRDPRLDRTGGRGSGEPLRGGDGRRDPGASSTPAWPPAAARGGAARTGAAA